MGLKPGKPKVPHGVVSLRAAVVAVMLGSVKMTPEEAQELIKRYEAAARSAGWSEGYDAGQEDFS